MHLAVGELLLNGAITMGDQAGALAHACVMAIDHRGLQAGPALLY